MNSSKSHRFSVNELKEYQMAFDFFDENHDGLITMDELNNAMRKCGHNLTKLELKLIMKKADKDQNGVITLNEFIDLMEYPKKMHYTSSDLLKQFRTFDKDGDGFIVLKELSDIVKELNISDDFPPEDIDTLFKEIDSNKDGKISFHGLSCSWRAAKKPEAQPGSLSQPGRAGLGMSY